MWSNLTKLSRYISIRSWFFIYLNVALTLVTLRPTLYEFMFMFFIDGIALLVFGPIDGRLFKWLFPDTKAYFDNVDFADLKTLSHDGHLKLYDSFLKFPKRRALFCALFSYVKVLPGIMVITFYWHHEISTLEQFGIAVAAASLSVSYFYGAVFIESHIFLSKLIDRIHREIDWSRVFREADVSFSAGDFDIQEAVTLATIMFFTIWLQWLIVSSGIVEGQTMAFLLTATGCMAFILYAYLWWLGRHFITGGLKDLFLRMNALDYRKPESDRVLSLHSTVLLARFEKSFNLLIDRLQKSEQEIASWVLREVEKSRYRTLGEMSALIAHDMNSSIHVIQFCVRQLAEDPERVKDPDYLFQLETNVSQLLRLMDSLRARLKNANPEAVASFLEAHAHTVRVLRTQYAANRFDSISFDIGADLEDLRLSVSRADLIHILENLYRNSVENLLANGVHAPKIAITLSERNDTDTTIKISDNGTGLTTERFDELTAFDFAKNGKPHLSGLGLKLVRRLTELNGGSLNLIDSEIDNAGTSFKLRIKHVTARKAQRTLQVEAIL